MSLCSKELQCTCSGLVKDEDHKRAGEALKLQALCQCIGLQHICKRVRLSSVMVDIDRHNISILQPSLIYWHMVRFPCA